MNHFDEDWELRLASFAHVQTLVDRLGPVLPWSELVKGFTAGNGQRITLIGQRGIWRPRGWSTPISITTSHRDPYGDIADEKDGFLRYRYFGTDPHHGDNLGLRQLMSQGRPLIYFKGIEVGQYSPVFPAVIVEDDPSSLTFTIACEDVTALVPGVAPDTAAFARRRYATRLALIRLHQGEFRSKVLSAYRSQCVICHLKHTPLLDAAHIIPDREHGEPIVPNGLSMCKIHHAAFDANILGITPGSRVEIREDILEEVDGPMLRHGLQELHGTTLLLPVRNADRPDPERLEIRYEEFRQAG